MACIGCPKCKPEEFQVGRGINQCRDYVASTSISQMLQTKLMNAMDKKERAEKMLDEAEREIEYTNRLRAEWRRINANGDGS